MIRVKKKTVSVLLLTLLLLGMLTLAFNIRPVRASGTIYIRPDGTVQGTTKIQQDGDIYTFTDTIYGPINVQKDNIVVDGAGYTLQGWGALFEYGIYMGGRGNVTIKNMEIKTFDAAMFLLGSSNNIISRNNITDSEDGIWLLDCSNNTVSGNSIADNWRSLYLVGVSGNILAGNNVANNSQGIVVDASSNNTIVGNNVANNWFSIVLGVESYRFDFSWYQFAKVRDLLAKSGFNQLGQYASEIRTGGSVKKADAGVIVLGTRDLKPYVVLPRGEKPRIVEQIRESNWATSGQVLMAEVGGDISVGTTALVPSDCSHWRNLGFSVRKNGIAVSPDIIILSVRPSRIAGFVTTFLNSLIGRIQLKALSFTTKQTRVRPYEIDKILIPEPESTKEHSQLLEEMYKSIISIRRIIDIEIPKELELDPMMVMKGARPYLRGIRSSNVTLNSYA